MASLYGTQMAKLVNTPYDLPDPGFVGGGLQVFAETVTYAAQTTSDIIYVGRLPKGAIPLFGILIADTSSGSTTLALGISGSTAKYRAAAAFTSTDTPTLFGKAAAFGQALTADEDLFFTLAGATAPSSGTLRVIIVYAVA